VIAVDGACDACKGLDNPMTINTVTLSLVYHQRKGFEASKIAHGILRDIAIKRDTVGPGTNLKRILIEIGIASDSYCGCDAFAVKMNRWGVEGCEVRKNEIIEHLNMQAISWLDMVKVALAGYLTTGSLFEECISRAKVLH
jgi:hypothetical protein